MLPTSANSSSSVNDCEANVYNSEADLKFIQTSKCIYTKWHFDMGDFPFSLSNRGNLTRGVDSRTSEALVKVGKSQGVTTIRAAGIQRLSDTVQKQHLANQNKGCAQSITSKPVILYKCKDGVLWESAGDEPVLSAGRAPRSWGDDSN